MSSNRRTKIKKNPKKSLNGHETVHSFGDEDPVKGLHHYGDSQDQNLDQNLHNQLFSGLAIEETENCCS